MNEIPSNLIMASGLVGYFLPLVIAVIVQTGWDSRAKSVAAFVSCAIAAFAICYFQGNLNGQDYVTSALIVLTLALTTYQGQWKPLGLAGSIEKATTI